MLDPLEALFVVVTADDSEVALLEGNDGGSTGCIIEKGLFSEALAAREANHLSEPLFGFFMNLLSNSFKFVNCCLLNSNK